MKMLMSPENIRKDENFKNFIKNREIRESTEILYARRLNDFCKFIDKTPTQLVEEALEEQNLKAEDQKIHNFVEEYLDELKEDGKSTNTIKNRYDTLKAFFSEFNVKTPNIKNSITPHDKLTIGEIPDIDDVRKAIQISGLRDKAIILLHFASGMGAIELRYLTYGDFIDSVEEYLNLNPDEKLNLSKVISELDKRKDIIGTWQIKKIKSGIDYITFNTPESTQAILDYLADREMNNKLIKSFEDPLFVNTWNKPLAKSVHGAIFKRINDKAGFGHMDGKRRFFTSGKLRKTFEKTMFKADVDKITIDCFLGYKINDMNESDLRDMSEFLKTQYINALDYLKLDNSYEGSNSEFEMLLTKFNEKDKELEQIKEHMKYLEKKMNSISNSNENQS
jgi:site-specific recombinase XerD